MKTIKKRGKKMTRCSYCGAELYWNGKKFIHIWCNKPSVLNEKKYQKTKGIIKKKAKK